MLEQAHALLSSSASFLLPEASCTGISLSRDHVCVFVFNSLRWTSLPWIGLIFPCVFLAAITSDGNKLHSVARQFVKEYIYIFPLLSTSYTMETMKECSVCHLPVIQAVTLSLELAVASSLEQAFFLFPFCMEVKLLYFSLISIKKNNNHQRCGFHSDINMSCFGLPLLIGLSCAYSTVVP